MNLKLMAAAMAVATAFPAFSQVAPSATGGGMRIEAGGGFSYFKSDLGGLKLPGGALWVDGYPAHLPPYLHGLGLEAEARGVRTPESSATEIGSFRQETIGGEPTYSWYPRRNLRPYAKFIADFAAQDFFVGAQSYRHETQMAYALGGGVEYRVYRDVWARGDYEYQIWPNPFNNPNWYLDPQGITVGLSLDLKALHRH
jgi:hypothetical protein